MSSQYSSPIGPLRIRYQSLWRPQICTRWVGATVVALFICVSLWTEDSIPTEIGIVSNTKRIEYKSYCVRPNVIANSQPEYDRITLILHISADYLDERIVEQVTNWKAPVSLAIYLDNPKEQYSCVMIMLQKFLTEDPSVGEHLQVHFVYKKAKDQATCTSDFSSTCRTTPTNRTVQKTADYPVNTIRNLARKFSQTKYILIADYEHLFSGGFEERMRRIAQKELVVDSKQLLVYRIFEIEENLEKGPRNKSELTALLKNGTAVVFHAAFYPTAHNMPGLDQWLKKKDGNNSGIFHRNMKYTRHSWEPQFVSLASIPKHDEQFPYLVRDNTCLRWELCRAGYHFSLVDDLFMYHRGIKRANSTGLVFSRKVQRTNSKRFKVALSAFQNRMNTTYPKTLKKCPAFRG